MSRHFLTLMIWAASGGAAFAQGQPGDAEFCRRYATTTAAAAETAIAANPACLDYGTGLHGDRRMHTDWCARTASDEVEGASTHVRRLAARCSGGAVAAPNDYGGYDVVGHETFEKPYAHLPHWDVRAAFGAGIFMYCVATPSDGDRKVRIGVDLATPSDGEQWQLAVPLRAEKDWQGTFEVDGRGFGNGGGAQTSGTAIGDWTIAWLSRGDVDGLRAGHEAILGVGKFDYDFDLRGIAAAIDEIENCRTRRGGEVPGG